MKLFIIFLLIAACARVESKEPGESDKIDLVRDRVEELSSRLVAMEDQHGWVAKDCDAMLWEGKLRAAIGGGSLHAAEREPGRYGRRPDPCWDQEDLGSATTWSRDMGVGFLYWTWRNKEIGALVSHGEYGKKNNWVMGEPLADLRVVYTPNMIGTLYEAIYNLGGPSDPNRHWPNHYDGNLSDYEAHLLVLRIALRGEIAGSEEDRPKKPEAEATASISSIMYQRLEEQAKREPGNALFQAVLGHYSGDMTKAIDACLSDYVAEYVRCSDDSCKMIDKLFSCDYILRVFDNRWTLRQPT